MARADETSPEEAERPGSVIDVLVVAGPDTYESEVATSSTRTPTPLERTPQSVSVVTRRLIEDQQVSEVSDALANVSGVVATNTLLTPAFDNTLIRGFPAEQSLDGFTQYYNPGDRGSLVDVERIEVLKGTNGVVYGGGAGAAVGGLVDVISKTPRAAPSRALGIRVGSNDLVQPFFDVNQPLGEHARVRITGEYTESGSEIDVLENRRFNVNPALSLVGEDTSVVLRGKVSRWRQPDYQGLPATGTVVDTGPEIGRHLFVGDPDIEDSRSAFDRVSAHLEHRFDETWHASVQARYARSEFEESAQLISGGGLDFGADRPIIEPPELSESLGFGSLPFAFFDAKLFQEQEEVSVVANATAEAIWGPVASTWLFGADYSSYDDEGFLNALAVPDPFIVDLADPDFDTPYTTPGPGENDNFLRNEVTGGYAQLQASFWERLHLLAGVRLGRVKIDFEGPGTRDVTDETRWVPRVGAVLDLVEGLSLFIGYGEGMRGQPFAIFSETPKPEESTQWEVGLKAALPGRVQAQLAYYEIERRNVTVPDPEGGFGSVARGRQASHGIDFEVIVHPVPALSLLGTYAWTRASFEDDLFASFGSDIDAIPGVPEHSGRFWAHYDLSAWLDGLGIGAGVYAQEEVQISRRNAFYADDFYTVDASIQYETDRLVLGLRVSNLTDQDYFVRLGYLGARVAPAPGRAWQLTTAVRF